MPVAQPTAASGTLDVMKTEDGKDSVDTLVKQANGLEPVLYYPRIGESSVQWLQFLQALEQPEPIWPLLSVVTKVQLRKCEKCSREFCSPINYRRHLRIDHRLKKLDKDSINNRDLLGEYWDKLSVEEAMEVVSFEDMLLEEVPGSSILKGVANLRRQAFSSLPQNYMRAGFSLLDMVQSNPSSFPISSQELFSILDDASEETFLCGTAVSVQRFMFDGEAGKIVLEPRNLIACTSFLLEQKLVKACLAYKEAEALRLQQLLVDEEEAAQKRQAEILERKRKKKLRQKEQKARERLEDDMKIDGNISSTGEDMSPAEASLAAFDFEAHNPDIPADHDSSTHVTYQCPDTTEGVDGETQPGNDYDPDQIIEQQTSQGHNRLLPMTARQQELPKSQAPVANGLCASQNSQMSKLGAIQKYGTNCDQNAAPIVNGGEVVSLKPEPKTTGVVSEARLHKEPYVRKNHEVLIGSVSVTLANCSQSEGSLVPSRGVCPAENLAKQNTAQEKPIKLDCFQGGEGSLANCSQSEGTLVASRGVCPAENLAKQNTAQEKPIKLDCFQGGEGSLANCSQSEGTLVASRGVCPAENLAKQNTAQEKPIKLDCFQGGEGSLTPVNQHESKGPLPPQNGGAIAEVVDGKDGQNSLTLCNIDDNGLKSKFSQTGAKGDRERLQFSSHAARAFLDQRWKEAISSDHVKLVLSPDTTSQHNQDCEVAPCLPANTEKPLPAASGGPKSKHRKKPGKEMKTKYIPKQKPTAA
ncbi:uncharacterized protein LOC130717959 [Lotus japonicus]|uniref:uncharacterized protein LOC130717959 n=1 Tax=Lotus japonicus TaxID=34305 RepID=UPI0025909D4E|nr:uncharacterized protein LOC130717959 [Lotus japonicus]XP_057424359.1 uncharacterized protein LOC130717959 [Lotus japonicus]